MLYFPWGSVGLWPADAGTSACLRWSALSSETLLCVRYDVSICDFLIFFGWGCCTFDISLWGVPLHFKAIPLSYAVLRRRNPQNLLHWPKLAVWYPVKSQICPTSASFDISCSPSSSSPSPAAAPLSPHMNPYSIRGAAFRHNDSTVCTPVNLFLHPLPAAYAHSSQPR